MEALYWLFPTITSTRPAPEGAKPNVPPTREHANHYSWVWPQVPKQQHAIAPFVMNENARLGSHARGPQASTSAW